MRVDKLFIIDAVNFLFRSYFAIRPMTAPNGETTHALFGFIRSLNKLIKEFAPTHLVAVFDGPDNKRSRTEIYEAYKAHRTKMPDDLFCQLERALQYCQLASIPTLMVPGVEADDTMGSVAKWAEKEGFDVFLCSSDKDLCQLVSSHIRIINIHKENLLIDKEKVEELFGVKPHQMIDYLAIVGDASDNIPGLEGFGPKITTALLNEFGSLETLLNHPEAVKGKKQEVLIRDQEIALLSKQLATIDLNVSFPQKKEFFALTPPDLKSLHAFFQEMHFQSFLKEEKKDPADTNYQLIDDEQALERLIDRLQQHKTIAIDLQTHHKHPLLAQIWSISFSVGSHTAWYLPLQGKIPKKRALLALQPLLNNPHIAFCGHGLKIQLHALRNEKISLNTLSFDTLIAAHLLAPETQEASLDLLVTTQLQETKTPLPQNAKNKALPIEELSIEQATLFACENADYIGRLQLQLHKQLEENKLLEVLETIELPLIPVLVEMERTGMYLDQEALQKISLQLTDKIDDLEEKIYQLTGRAFNINSPKQLGDLLFNEMGIKSLKKTATGYSTAAPILEALKKEHPVIDLILTYRALTKLRSTYVDALPTQISTITERIHPTFNQTITATGRLSCQDPNLQNIPIRSEEGRTIRACFKPQKAGWSYLAADYSQIELRLLAHLSEDPTLIKAFQEGEDIHAFTASLVFNIPLQEVSPRMRYLAKAVNFGIIYGQQAFGLAQGADMEFKEAAQFIDTYFKRYSKVKEFFEFCKESTRKTGYAITMSGRLRPIPDIHSKNPILRAQAERFAMNTPLQGSSADITKLAMIEISRLLARNPDYGLLTLQIHDELLFEAPDACLPELSLEVKKIMENIYPLKVPLVVDISLGKNWGEC